VETELFHVNGRPDGQTDMTNLIFAYCNFENEPKNHFIDLHNHIESDKKNVTSQFRTHLLYNKGFL